MSFDAKNVFVYDMFNRCQYQIPRNQRKYVWAKRNWQEFYDDICSVANGIYPSHFIGSIVLKDEGRKIGLPTYTIIDGQQRVITLSILLSCVMFWIKRKGMNDDFEGTKQYVQARDDKARDIIMVTSDYHVSLEKIIEKIIYADRNECEEQTISSFVDTCAVDLVKDKNIIDAFKFFLSSIGSAISVKENPNEYLISLRDAIVNISYVSVISSTEEDAYTIFEILNARGLELADHELLKNYIMRYLQPQSHRDSAKVTWDCMETMLGGKMRQFIKHYTTHMYRSNPKETEKDYKIIRNANRTQSTETLLYDLNLKAQYYTKLVSPCGGADGNCTDVEEKVYSFFKRKRQEQLRPVLLSLIHQKELEHISQEDYHNILNFLYNFHVCYSIIGEENSNKLTNVIYKYASVLENNYSPEVLNEFITSLKEKLPNRETFISAFTLVGWSHHGTFYGGEKNKERVQTVLEIYEKFLSSGLCQDGMTIEHVLDDSESGENGIIGNLLPLEDALNHRCNGKNFSDKCDIYSDSNYRSARKFSERYKGRNFDPKVRTKFMAEEFYDAILQYGAR